MALVLDASVAACWLLPDEMHEVADKARAILQTRRGNVPAMWWFEVHNLFVMAERRKRVDADWTENAIGLIAEMPVDIDRDASAGAIVNLARKHRLTFYDAAYLELAIRKSVPLATLDAALIDAAKAEQVKLL